jgi:hypothetical protein
LFVVLHPFVLKICLSGFPSRPPSSSKNDPKNGQHVPRGPKSSLEHPVGVS